MEIDYILKIHISENRDKFLLPILHAILESTENFKRVAELKEDELAQMRRQFAETGLDGILKILNPK